MAPVAEFATRVIRPDLELTGGARSGALGVQPVEVGGAPIDAVHCGEHLQPAFDEAPPLGGRRLVEEPLTQVRRVLDGHLPLDEAHHEERRAEHRRVVLVADERRDGHPRVRSDAVHSAVLDGDLDIEAGCLRRIDRGIGGFAAQHESFGAIATIGRHRRVDHERLGRVAALRRVEGLDDDRTRTGNAGCQPLPERVGFVSSIGRHRSCSSTLVSATGTTGARWSRRS